MLERAIRADEEKLPEAQQRLRMAAENLLNKAADGDLKAMQEIGDRIDGKPPQSLDIGSQDGKGVTVQLSQNDAKVL